MEPPSPCVGICKIVQRTGQCRGCGRTVAEIRSWKTATDEERRAILARLPARLQAMDAAGDPRVEP